VVHLSYAAQPIHYRTLRLAQALLDLLEFIVDPYADDYYYYFWPYYLAFNLRDLA